MILLQLATIFETSIDQLFYRGSVSVSPCNDQTDASEIKTAIQVKREKVRSLMYNCNEKEMDFVLEFMEYYYNVLRHDKDVTMNRFYYTF